MKKIALVVDVENWCFYNIAQNIIKRLSDYFEFKLIVMANIDDNIVKLWLSVQDCDLVHFFWRGHGIYNTFDNYGSYIKQLGGDIQTFENLYVNDKIVSMAVYDHLFLNDNHTDYTTKLFNKYENYYVSSNVLRDIYNKLDIKHKPKMVITDGVDFSKFYPININRFDNIENREIVIGWVGNSHWQDKTSDFKGVNTILKPAIKELQEEGFNIVEYFADKQVRSIPHEKMCDYYSKIDLYICTSIAEGTPNPVLESMACGVPIISTNVGIVADAFGDEQTKLILEERTKECLKDKIKYLLDNRHLFKVCSGENLEQIKKWSWVNICQDFKIFFEKVLYENKK